MASTAEPTRLSLKITLRSGGKLGPGKIALLEAIDSLGSISAAGRSFGMSYRRAWELVDDMNRTLEGTVVSTAAGGTGGGGARLTQTGRAVVEAYRSSEAAARLAAQAYLDNLDRLSRPPNLSQYPDRAVSRTLCIHPAGGRLRGGKTQVLATPGTILGRFVTAGRFKGIVR